jgi:hypothetical protein
MVDTHTVLPVPLGQSVKQSMPNSLMPAEVK